MPEEGQTLHGQWRQDHRGRPVGAEPACPGSPGDLKRSISRVDRSAPTLGLCWRTALHRGGEGFHLAS